MLDDENSRLDLAGLSLRENERPKRLGRNDVGGNAALGEFDAVVETPR